MADLKRTDVQLLKDALKTNGGGVDWLYHADKTIRRCLEAGLIQRKPNQHKSNNHCRLLTITPAGREALTAHERAKHTNIKKEGA